MATGYGPMSSIRVIVPVVEGDGEVEAVPVLLSRLMVHQGIIIDFRGAYNAHSRFPLVEVPRDAGPAYDDGPLGRRCCACMPVVPTVGQCR